MPPLLPRKRLVSFKRNKLICYYQVTVTIINIMIKLHDNLFVLSRGEGKKWSRYKNLFIWYSIAIEISFAAVWMLNIKRHDQPIFCPCIQKVIWVYLSQIQPSVWIDCTTEMHCPWHPRAVFLKNQMNTLLSLFFNTKSIVMENPWHICILFYIDIHNPILK